MNRVTTRVLSLIVVKRSRCSESLASPLRASCPLGSPAITEELSDGSLPELADDDRLPELADTDTNLARILSVLTKQRPELSVLPPRVQVSLSASALCSALLLVVRAARDSEGHLTRADSVPYEQRNNPGTVVSCDGIVRMMTTFVRMMTALACSYYDGSSCLFIIRTNFVVIRTNFVVIRTNLFVRK